MRSFWQTASRSDNRSRDLPRRRLLPHEPVDLPDGTHLEIAIEAPDASAVEPYALLKVLEEVGLDGPPDGSEHINECLTGQRTYHGRTIDGRDVSRG